MPVLAWVLVLVAAATARAEPQKLAVMPFTGGAGVTEQVAASLTEAAVAELRRLPDLVVVTPKEVAAVLSLDQQRLLLGCDQGDCVTDLGGALGVDRIVLGDLSKLGESWLMHVKLIDVKRAATVKQADRRLRGKAIDDVLDALGPLLAELLDRPFTTPDKLVAAAGQTTPPPAASAAVDQPAGLTPELRARMRLATDGKGFYVAWDPERALSGPFYAGTAQGLWAQRVFGGGRDGESFSATFWEPRAKARWQASFGFQQGRYTLQCGDQAIALTPVPPAEAKPVLAKAPLYQPRWRRYAVAIARDDEGSYWFVDKPREPEDSTEFRLFVGRKNKLTRVEVEEFIGDEGGELFLTPSGKLRIDRRARKAEWVENGVRSPLVYLEVEDQAAFIYGALGVYRGEKFGSACDGRF